MDVPGGSDGKVSAYNVGDQGSISGLGRSPGEGNGTPLQYSYLENPMDTVHRVAKSWTRPKDLLSFLSLLSLLYQMHIQGTKHFFVCLFVFN